jgi:hypothetical protein
MNHTNYDGKANIFAKEPPMYISEDDMKKYENQTHNEYAELLNSRLAMLGIAIGVISKITTGSFFFFGLFN